MEFFRTGKDAWGQEILQGVSWDLLGVFVLVGLLFIALHMILMAFKTKR